MKAALLGVFGEVSLRHWEIHEKECICGTMSWEEGARTRETGLIAMEREVTRLELNSQRRDQAFSPMAAFEVASFLSIAQVLRLAEVHVEPLVGALQQLGPYFRLVLNWEETRPTLCSGGEEIRTLVVSSLHSLWCLMLDLRTAL